MLSDISLRKFQSEGTSRMIHFPGIFCTSLASFLTNGGMEQWFAGDPGVLGLVYTSSRELSKFLETCRLFIKQLLLKFKLYKRTNR